jgi:AbrB family looped-hinge helix DNA binding protein
MTSIVKLQKKGQLTIPNHMREQIGLAEGDYIQVASRGSKIILEPAQVATRPAAEELRPAQKRQLDARLAEGLADVKAGCVHGPFATAKEASVYIERVVGERKARKLRWRLDEHVLGEPATQSKFLPVFG